MKKILMIICCAFAVLSASAQDKKLTLNAGFLFPNTLNAMIGYEYPLSYGNAVQSLMHQHGTYDRTERIEDAVGREAEPAHADIHAVKDKAHADQCQSRQHRIDDHCLDVELQRLLCLGSDTDYTDANQFCHLAARHGVEHLEAGQKVQDKLRDTVIRRDGKIHHNLDDEKDVDATAEVVVHLLLFPGFFECHCYCI